MRWVTHSACAMGHFDSELMNGSGQDLFRMNQPDIDTVNPSGIGKGLPQKVAMNVVRVARSWNAPEIDLLCRR